MKVSRDYAKLFCFERIDEPCKTLTYALLIPYGYQNSCKVRLETKIIFLGGVG